MITPDESDGDAGSSGENGGKQKPNPTPMEAGHQHQLKTRTQQKVGKIGEGKDIPLSSNQRKRTLYAPVPLTIEISLS